ncbi:thiamine phosphate synthase [Mesobacillus harenae]|uniref:thiamine phosphate synthase n=1 Tax=Mesobacillus harenae TaxID=2213203 RepID=UPI00157FF0DF|nr:thiamine phosphate synthase [Mesobacillus harenae]
MERIEIDQMRNYLRVYFILGSTNCINSPAEVLTEAIKGGVTLFQFREKGNSCLQGESKLKLAKQLQAICKTHQIPFIVNDDIELALALNADGVHIGQDDEPAAVVRKKIGNKILGVSAHNLIEAKEAVEAGADYLGLGPIYPTSTKEDAKAVQGIQLIAELRAKKFTIPLVGIGGIHAGNTAPVIEAGADGISVITAISHADSSVSAAKELRQTVELNSSKN